MTERWGIIGCGWLGLPYAKYLTGNGIEVVGTTTSPEKLKKLDELGIVPILLSLKENQVIGAELATCNYILLNIPPSSLQDKYAERLSALAKQFNPKSKVIFISSTSVYSDKNQVAQENDELDGEGRNAPFIIEAERELDKVLEERLTIIRMAGLVGGDRHPAKFMSGKNYQEGMNRVNLIHLEDCIGIINKVKQENYFGEILNGCTTEHPNKMNYYKHAAEKLNIIPPSFQQNEGRWKKVSNKKSKTSLNYSYKYDSPYDFPL